MRHALVIAHLLFSSALCLPAVSAQTTPAKKGSVNVPPAVDAVRMKIVDAMNAGDADAFFALLNAAMRDVLPADKAADFITGIVQAKGKISAAQPTRSGPRSAIYILTAERGQWQLSLDLDDAGLIAGLYISEPTKAPPVASSKIPLGLPFKGSWSVFWGGDNAKVNHHVRENSQRRAADLLITGAGGKSFKGDGKLNHDYYAYGQEILAVADGKVIAAIDGVPDNIPGSMNPYMVCGNTVIIEHDPKLFSAYCHLQRGTVAVKLDQKVRRGDRLGLCGNSGHSSEPHLHFQLQDGPLFESSFGIEAVFDNISVTRDGSRQSIPKYRFLKGDIIDAGK